jgi:hypothetical protein
MFYGIPESDVLRRAFFHQRPKDKNTKTLRHGVGLRVSVVNAFAPFGCGGAALGSLRLIHPRPLVAATPRWENTGAWESASFGVNKVAFTVTPLKLLRRKCGRNA